MFLRRLDEFVTHAFRSPRRPPGIWRRQARRISGLAERLSQQPESELRQKAAALRYRAKSGEQLTQLLPEAYACVVAAATRQLNLTHFHVQILAGIALHRGCIAEMQTGEGKTLVATLPVFLNALQGLPVHVATANDYLARRDADWMRPVYESLGLTVSAVTGDMSPADRRLAYDCDITYGTAREFGFDFLRDRLSLRAGQHSSAPLFAESLLETRSQPHATNRRTVQRHPLHFALIDEADSLLIDEARTPLIISSEAADQRTREALYRWCSSASEQFELGEHLSQTPDSGQLELTSAGYRLVRALPRPPILNELPMSEITDGVVRAAYVAQSLVRDEHYVVQDGKVHIVDEYSGRIAEGRKWRNGIHQAVEARELVEITPLSTQAARITVQELFRQYDRLSGMTGTASPAAFEFLSVYQLPVLRIPTRRATRRQVWSCSVSATSEERWQGVADEAREIHQAGRPVLIGTRTIEQSEKLSALLEESGIEHQVLNALNPAGEAEIIAEAGQPGRVTVATNMAGRGTDIRLLGNSSERGGLHVICGQLHSAARIDRQLTGRCARQGDPGSCRQFMSLEDDVLEQALPQDEHQRLQYRVGNSTSALASSVSEFKRAQRLLERRHEQDRALLMAQVRHHATELIQLGQDPWLDAAQNS